MKDSKYLLTHIKQVWAMLRNFSLFTQIFFAGLFITFIGEGTGIVTKSTLFPFFILFTLILFLISWKEKYLIPQKMIWVFFLSFGYLMYLLFLTNYSFNRQVSFEYVVFLLSLFLLFVIILKKWQQVERPFLHGLLGLGVFFSLYAFVLPYLLNYLSFFSLYPHSGYQYVYSLFGTNNHLGEFLVFPMLITLYLYFQKKKNYAFLFGFYFIFFIFSYSRAAYISFFIGFLVLILQQKQSVTATQKKAFIGISIVICLFLILTSTSLLQNSNLRFLSQYLVIYGKSSFDTRGEYILQTVEGFLQYRYFGIGIGNFSYISKMYAYNPTLWTASSHNIFLDMLVETGTVGFIGFIFFFIILLKKIKEYSRGIYVALLLSWLTILQFDYLHQMYSYLLLFPLLLVGLLSSKEEIHKKTINISFASFAMGTLLLAFFAQYTVSTYVLTTGEYSLSRKIYPIQQAAYEKEYVQSDVSGKKVVLSSYTLFFPGDYWGFYKLGKIAELEGNMIQASEYYEKSFWLDPYRDLGMAQRIYTIKMNFMDKKNARSFADKLFKKLDNESGQQMLSYDQWLFINKFCQKVYNLHCPYTLE